jgi:hypothetical protein
MFTGGDNGSIPMFTFFVNIVALSISSHCSLMGKTDANVYKKNINMKWGSIGLLYVFIIVFGVKQQHLVTIV